MVEVKEERKKKRKNKGGRAVEGHTSVRLDPKTKQKLEYIAKQEKSPVAAVLRLWIMQGISYYINNGKLFETKEINLERKYPGRKRVFTELED